MKALTVDFRSKRIPSRSAWLLVGVMAVFALLLVLWDVAQQHRLSEQRTELARLVSGRVAIPPPTRSGKSPPPYEASAREFLALAETDWPSVLTALESATTIGVTPVSIDITPGDRSIRVDVEFLEYEALLAYIEALNAGEPSPRWALVQAQATNDPKTPSLATMVGKLTVEGAGR